MARTRTAWKLNDPVESAKRRHYSNARAQAKFRNEAWDLTYEQWLDIWGSYWQQRGKGKYDYCMVQVEVGAGWNPSNVIIETRIDWLQRIKTKEKTL